MPAACRRLPPPLACRLVCSLARLLASWDEELQRQLRTRSPGPVMLANTTVLATCCSAISGASTVARAVGASPADALEVCRAARLVQGSGRLAAQLLMATPGSLPAGASTQQARDTLTFNVSRQFQAMARLLTLVYDRGIMSEFAEQAVPPSALLPWLRAILAALQAVPQGECLARGGRRGGQGTAERRFLRMFDARETLQYGGLAVRSGQSLGSMLPPNLNPTHPPPTFHPHPHLPCS